jgi:hypothetical protein
LLFRCWLLLHPALLLLPLLLLLLPPLLLPPRAPSDKPA